MSYTFYEECWFIYGFKAGPFYVGFLKYHSKGQACSVEFDWEKALDKKVIGWYHTHPGTSFTYPSSVDHRTTRSWVYGVNKPMLCGIKCNGRQKCYCFHKCLSEILYTVMHSVIIGNLFIGVNSKETMLSR